MATIGTVTKHDDGRYDGELRTLSVRADITIMPVTEKASHPHQFRFAVSADEGRRLADLKPFIRDLLSQMERDLDTKLDWVAVDHFNTGHPHTHIVIRRPMSTPLHRQHTGHWHRR